MSFVQKQDSQQALQEKTLTNEKEILFFCNSFNSLLFLLNKKTNQNLSLNSEEISKISLSSNGQGERAVIYFKNGSTMTFYNAKDGFTLLTSSIDIRYTKNEGLYIVSKNKG
ncbi:MAG: hypothetical protein ACK4J0_01365 [Candidatus Anstonellaceae archaeon]